MLHLRRRLQHPEPAAFLRCSPHSLDKSVEIAAEVKDGLFVVIALSTSMRHGEILAARWEYLDLSRRRLSIPAKAGARAQPIPRELADILARECAMRDDHEGWIFPSPRGATVAGHRLSMRKPFRAAVAMAGLDPRRVTPHTLRHTAITKLVENGVDLPTAQRISGHKTTAMLIRYSHVHAPHIDKAIEVLGTAGTITPELHQRPSEGAAHRPPKEEK